MKLERAMQQRVVMIIRRIEHKLQGEVGMHALVVMQRPVSQSPEAQDRTQQDHAPESSPHQQLLSRWRYESPSFQRFGGRFVNWSILYLFSYIVLLSLVRNFRVHGTNRSCYSLHTIFFFGSLIQPMLENFQRSLLLSHFPLTAEGLMIYCSSRGL